MATTPSGRNFYYKRLTITKDEFQSSPDFDFGFQATSVMIVNDNEDDIIMFSFRKPYLDGELFCFDGPWVADGIGEGRLWVKVLTGKSVQVRVWAWRT